MIDFEKIKALSNEIARQFNPMKVILFGSYAYGKPDEYSDVDLLVIMPFKGRGMNKAAEILEKTNPVFPVEILVRTPEDMDTRLKWNDFFLREIVEKGEILYESARS
ncbi:MAG: nucleotidyltransferase domain-containing protein [Nitrospinae bacterium]|nr:nucleotidyltransferase domain-containing protein [Nitrospinota bacterium]